MGFLTMPYFDLPGYVRSKGAAAVTSGAGSAGSITSGGGDGPITNETGKPPGKFDVLTYESLVAV